MRRWSKARAAPFRWRRAISAAIRARASRARSRTPCSARCAPIPARLLVFLPGAAEIRRTETLLKERVTDTNVDIVALFGALDAREQDRAISPAPPGRRKVVLATSIAETSLTIEGVRVVIDSGLSRVPRYEPDVGLTRLETVRVSRAAADQRRGRAGRTEPGVCYRLWDEPQTGSLEPYTRPEILSADLSSFVLDLAQWGASDPGKLAFLDPPPQAALTEAQGAAYASWAPSTRNGRITEEGRKLARVAAAAAACAHGGRCRRRRRRRTGGGDRRDAHRARPWRRRCRFAHRLDQFRRDRSRRAEDARAMVKRWADTCRRQRRDGGDHSRGALLALAYPDRIAKNRGGGAGAFLLANGRGGTVDPASALAREPFLAVAELTGSGGGEPHRAGGADHARRDRGALCRPDRGSRDGHVRRRLRSLRARRSAPARRARAGRADQAGRARCRDRAQLLAEGIAALGIDKLPWSKARCNCATACCSCAEPKARNGPICRTTALARNAAEWLAPLLADKTRAGANRRRRTIRRARCAAAVDSAQAARRRGADAFHRAVRLARADRLRGRGGAEGLDPRAGIVRAWRSIRPSPAAACRW